MVGVVIEPGLVVVGVVVVDCANAVPMKDIVTPRYRATCATATTKLASEFLFISNLRSTYEHREDLPYRLEHPTILRLRRIFRDGSGVLSPERCARRSGSSRQCRGVRGRRSLDQPALALNGFVQRLIMALLDHAVEHLEYAARRCKTPGPRAPGHACCGRCSAQSRSCQTGGRFDLKLLCARHSWLWRGLQGGLSK
jgi:hypothetical protein